MFMVVSREASWIESRCGSNCWRRWRRWDHFAGGPTVVSHGGRLKAGGQGPADPTIHLQRGSVQCAALHPVGRFFQIGQAHLAPGHPC